MEMQGSSSLAPKELKLGLFWIVPCSEPLVRGVFLGFRAVAVPLPPAPEDGLLRGREEQPTADQDSHG